MSGSDPESGSPAGGRSRLASLSPSLPPHDLSSEKLLAFVPRDGQGRPGGGGLPLPSRLGKGGMGAVYYAVHPRLNVEVAVKILPFTLVEQDPRLVDRF